MQIDDKSTVLELFEAFSSLPTSAFERAVRARWRSRRIEAESEKLRSTLLSSVSHDQEADKIAALESGADDYLTKPFSAGKLLVRLKLLCAMRARHR